MQEALNSDFYKQLLNGDVFCKDMFIEGFF